MAIYIDIGLAALLIISILIGAIKGFAKQFNRGFCGFLSVIGSIALTVLIVPALQKAGALNSLSGAATNWFKGEAFTTVVSDQAALTELMSSGFLKILSKLSPRIWNTMVAYEMTTLGAFFGNLCARLIIGLIIWIALLLIFKLVFWAIRFLLKKLSGLPVLHTLDKIFGALWAAAIALVIIFIGITTFEIVIIKWLPSAVNLETLVNDSKIYQILHEFNVAGARIAEMLGVDLASFTAIN